MQKNKNKVIDLSKINQKDIKKIYNTLFYLNAILRVRGRKLSIKKTPAAKKTHQDLAK